MREGDSGGRSYLPLFPSEDAPESLHPTTEHTTCLGKGEKFAKVGEHPCNINHYITFFGSHLRRETFARVGEYPCNINNYIAYSGTI